MEWRSIFHTSILIPHLVLRMVFTEKHMRIVVSGV